MGLFRSKKKGDGKLDAPPPFKEEKTKVIGERDIPVISPSRSKAMEQVVKQMKEPPVPIPPPHLREEEPSEEALFVKEEKQYEKPFAFAPPKTTEPIKTRPPAVPVVHGVGGKVLIEPKPEEQIPLFPEIPAELPLQKLPVQAAQEQEAQEAMGEEAILPPILPEPPFYGEYLAQAEESVEKQAIPFEEEHPSEEEHISFAKFAKTDEGILPYPDQPRLHIPSFDELLAETIPAPLQQGSALPTKMALAGQLVFITLTKYKEVMLNNHNIKSRLEDCVDTVLRLRDIQENRHGRYEKWLSDLEKINKGFSHLDNIIFAG